jgi:Putative 2OG-Fe(II) oxygenase
MSVAAATAPLTLRWEAPRSAECVSFSRLLPLLREAVAAAPDRADLKLHLAKALFHSDRMAEIVERLGPAVADDAADAEVLYCLGRAAVVVRDDQLALAALERAAAKGFGRAFGHLAATLIRLDRIDAALQSALQGLKHRGSNFESLQVIAHALLDRGEVERLWDLCADLRARGEWGGWLPAVMASAAARLGFEDEVSSLVNRPRWFVATRLAVPDDFNENLETELLGHKALRLVHSTKPTRGAGTLITQLQLAGGPLAQALLGRIRAVVDVYVTERRGFADDPMIEHRPAAVTLDGWAMAVHNDGFQTWHIHPDGWISGIYYVAMPKVELSDGGHPGAIEFGPHPFGRESDSLRSHRWHVRPEPGMLLLFPSYYAHRTWPTAVDDPRICVAFDVNPTSAAAE